METGQRFTTSLHDALVARGRKRYHRAQAPTASTPIGMPPPSVPPALVQVQRIPPPSDVPASKRAKRMPPSLTPPARTPPARVRVNSMSPLQVPPAPMRVNLMPPRAPPPPRAPVQAVKNHDEVPPASIPLRPEDKQVKTRWNEANSLKLIQAIRLVGHHLAAQKAAGHSAQVKIENKWEEVAKYLKDCPMSSNPKFPHLCQIKVSELCRTFHERVRMQNATYSSSSVRKRSQTFATQEIEREVTDYCNKVPLVASDLDLHSDFFEQEATATIGA